MGGMGPSDLCIRKITLRGGRTGWTAEPTGRERVVRKMLEAQT